MIPNNTMKILYLLMALMFVPLHASAEQEEDRLMGKVSLKAGLKLDASARREIAAAAGRIKKSPAGTVKLKGIYGAARSADEYLTKSVFMAREVERHLKTMLPPKQQIYAVTSQFAPGEKVSRNVVEIYFYPYELKPAEVESLKVTSTDSRDIVVKEEKMVTPVEVESDKGVSSSPAAVDIPVTYRQSAPQKVEEDARKAEELVNRVKERAAERARRRQRSD